MATLTPQQVAKTLREFFETHDWTQRVSARDHRGFTVHSRDENAVCWCIAGAYDKLIGGDWFDFSQAFVRVNAYNDPIKFNDNIAKTKTDVICALKKVEES